MNSNGASRKTWLERGKDFLALGMRAGFLNAAPAEDRAYRAARHIKAGGYIARMIAVKVRGAYRILDVEILSRLHRGVASAAIGRDRHGEHSSPRTPCRSGAAAIREDWTMPAAGFVK